MKIAVEKFGIQTKKEGESINITEDIRKFVKANSFKRGLVIIMIMHTSAAVTINEGTPCVGDDMIESMKRVLPESEHYHHARYLPGDGRMGINAASHIQASLIGNHALIAIKDGELLISSHQNVYIVEFDGPRFRDYVIEIIGE